MARILVIDDDKSILNLLKFKLSSEGFEVQTAQNDEEFRQKVREDKPDLLILDIWLGNKNGALVYDSLLAEGFDQQVPVIFLTALAQDRPQAPSAAPPGTPGRKVVLRAKPFDTDDLIKDIQKLVRAA
jgi:DNA-binding response OmpR family regulator